MRWLIVLVALLSAACGGSSAGPSAIPASSATTPTVQAIDVQPCPTAAAGVDLGFFRQIGCNGFELPIQSTRRWTIAPRLYIRTVDETGTPIDAVTLDTVQAAMTAVAPAWMNGRGLAGVERGAESREGVSGWITVKWPAPSTDDFACGRATDGVDGGWIALNSGAPGGASCGCNGSRIKPVVAKHELGHALGYWHTGGDSLTDVMSGQSQMRCDAGPSTREVQAAAYQYR